MVATFFGLLLIVVMTGTLIGVCIDAGWPRRGIDIAGYSALLGIYSTVVFSALILMGVVK